MAYWIQRFQEGKYDCKELYATAFSNAKQVAMIHQQTRLIKQHQHQIEYLLDQLVVTHIGGRVQSFDLANALQKYLKGNPKLIDFLTQLLSHKEFAKAAWDTSKRAKGQDFVEFLRTLLTDKDITGPGWVKPGRTGAVSKVFSDMLYANLTQIQRLEEPYALLRAAKHIEVEKMLDLLKTKLEQKEQATFKKEKVRELLGRYIAGTEKSGTMKELEVMFREDAHLHAALECSVTLAADCTMCEVASKP
ncbi:Hypothetical protein POVN_LOCUS250 [uncultured virus]|nr:Hypothetical protein POVN_LOCUS250 [uncultured virus]